MQDFIDRLAEETDQHSRISALLTASAGVLRTRGVRGADEFPLLQAIELTSESVIACRGKLLTAEAAFLERAGFEPLLKTMGIMVFLRCGLNPVESNTKSVVKHVIRTESATSLSALLDAYMRLLKISSNWIMGRYEAEPLCRAIRRLKPNDQDSFLLLRNDLSTALDLPATASRSDHVGTLLQKLRGLRAKSQLAGAREAIPEIMSVPAEPRPREVHVILVDFGANAEICVAGIAQERDAYHLWNSDAWSAFATRFVRLRRDQALHEFDRLYGQFAHHPQMDLGTLFDDQTNSEQRIRHVAYCDLTHAEIPLSWIGDPTNKYTMLLTGNWQEPDANEPLQAVSYWGRMCDRTPSLHIDDARRCLVFDSSGSRVLKYPTPISEDERTALSSTLPYSSYERWTLEDICRDVDLPLVICSDSKATRTAFLRTSWTTTSVLHLATHGHGDARDPECSYLEFANTKDGSTKVTFLDVLSMDWTGLRLVFLNACLTSRGLARVGEAALSMAWAFKASGANSVIANRWPVDDEVAWNFAQHFYDAWGFGLRDRSIQTAFSMALRSIRDTTRCPHQWGPFVLMH